MSLHGRFALVTGSSKGVGRGIALELGRQGCAVAVNYHSDAAGAAETVSSIEGAGGKAVAVQANVGLSSDCDRMFAEVLEAFGRLDVLVNNAGVQTWKALLDLEEAEWDRVIDTNLKGTFLCTQRAARAMKEQGNGGIIVNIGSGCNKIAFPHLVDYTASKGGIEQFTKVAAVELGKYRIRVNCVAPGAIEIERTKHEAGDYAGTWSALTPMGRVGHPADIGNAVAFLCEDRAEFITGQTVWVDGGLFSRPAWPYEI
jgi:NAD(P)-dependent dehydrogenase (short-subunit alcohol dehydrogenase family)